MRDIKEINADIAACDEKLARQLEQRMGYISEMIENKKASGLPILEPEIRAENQQKRYASAGGGMYRDEILGVFEKIAEESKHVQGKSLFNCNIALIGFMGAGKSTVTAYLKDAFAMQEADVDALIVKEQQMSIKDIFDKYGEPYFRNCESNAIISLRNVRQTIISCGGGAVMREENVRNLKQFSRIVLLTATPETTLARVKNSDERPILNGHMNVEFISELMAKRDERYREAADIVIATDGKDVRQICEELIGALVKAEKTGN